jgi:hypothetical protein
VRPSRPALEAKNVKRRSHCVRRPRIEGLPIQALYPVSELARVMGVSHRRLQKLLETSEVYVMRAGRFLYVPLTELEEKVPPLWESIKAAESLRRALDDV